MPLQNPPAEAPVPVSVDPALRRKSACALILLLLQNGAFLNLSVDVMPQHTHPELQRLRDSIDNIDAALVHLLAERFKFTKAVGEFKAAQGLPPADPAREAKQIERLRSLAEAAKLDPNFAEKFLTFIVREVIRHHEAIKPPEHPAV
jgi:chorismate mutase